MLTMIGLGLATPKDITLRGLEAVKTARAVFLEGYTSILQCTPDELEQAFGVPITVLTRAGVEERAERILHAAAEGDVAFLVVGDVFTATTHADLYLRAREAGIPVRVIPNAGILNAIGITGLELYKFGRTTTIVYPERNYAPESYYDVIADNHERGLHTLCLFDIKTDASRYMRVPEAIELLLAIAKRRGDALIAPNTKLLAAARIASETQQIQYDNATTLQTIDWGGPPHCLVVPGTLHIIEEEMLAQWQ